MNLGHLESFCTVVRLKNISEASKVLHVTQPTLSHQIQLLEEKLQVSLLRRSNRGVEPTEAGEIVCEYAQAFLQMRDSLYRELEKVKGAAPSLVVAAASMIGGYALPCSIYIFKERHPEASVVLKVANTTEVLRLVQTGQADIALTEGPLAEPAQVVDPIGVEELVIVAPAHRRWREDEEIDIEDLKKMPLIMREPGSGTRRTIEETLRGLGYRLEDFNVVMELNSNDSIKSAVEAGLGMAILPITTVRKELRAGTLRKIEIRNVALKHVCSISYPQGKVLNHLEKDFLRFIKSSQRGFC